jgi:2,4-dienoyl-CoA reductase-like NADH-dependent reductase (Old Yellow Enzyme family)
MSSLFDSGAVGSLQLKNRVVMAPMSRYFAAADATPCPEMAAYYAARAAGGCGLIISEGIIIDEKSARGHYGVPGLSRAEHVDAWLRITQAVHEAGGKIAAQLWHVGRLSHPDLLGGRQPIGPSSLASTGFHKQVGQPYGTPRAMTNSDIQEVLFRFAAAAKRAQDSGFDAVELHGAHGYLLDQFLSASTNQRMDAYGGSLENRLRFPVEVVRSVRAAVGTSFPVLYRISDWKVDDYSYRYGSQDEVCRILQALESAGVDCIHISTREAMAGQFGGSMCLAGIAKQSVQVPVIACGQLTPTAATTIVKRGDADFAAIGRPMIANPSWAALVQAGKLAELKAFDESLLKVLA